MKIIDLLNLIARGEEVPEFYYDNNLFVGGLDGSDISILSYLDEEKSLNDEVEIIEEEKEISKITKEEFERLDKRMLLELIVKNQNELIDEINKLRRDKE